MSLEGIVHMHNVTLANVTLDRGAIVSTTLNDYQQAIGYILHYYADEDEPYDVPLEVVPIAERGLFGAEFVVVNSTLGDCMYLLSGDVVQPGCPPESVARRQTMKQRAQGRTGAVPFGVGGPASAPGDIGFDYEQELEDGPEGALPDESLAARPSAHSFGLSGSLSWDRHEFGVMFVRCRAARLRGHDPAVLLAAVHKFCRVAFRPLVCSPANVGVYVWARHPASGRGVYVDSPRVVVDRGKILAASTRDHAVFHEGVSVEMQLAKPLQSCERERLCAACAVLVHGFTGGCVLAHTFLL